MKMSPNIDELYENYKAVLKSHFPEEFRRLLRIEENNIDGAKFQAALAAILQFFGLKTIFGETSGNGGVDFICRMQNVEFAAEATIINTMSMEAKTGMKHDQRGIDGGWFKPFPTLFQKLESKTKQVSEYKIPRAVFLGSFHNESSMLFDDGLADQYLSEFFKETGRNEYVPDKRLEEISAFFLVYFTYD